jgi:hypothetical protein
MDHVKIIEILATILTLIGVPIISIPRRFGMWILVGGQILWSIFAYLNTHFYFLGTSIFILICDFYAIYSWKKKGIK